MISGLETVLIHLHKFMYKLPLQFTEHYHSQVQEQPSRADQQTANKPAFKKENSPNFSGNFVFETRQK